MKNTLVIFVISCLFCLCAAKFKDTGILNVLVLPCSYSGYGYPVFTEINQNWNKYGSVQVFVNFTVAGNPTFTYNDLTTADVLYLSDSYSCTMTSAETSALSQYVSEGHNFIGTYVIFGATSGVLEGILGLDTIGSNETPLSGSQIWTQQISSPIFNSLPNPFTAASWPYNLKPNSGWNSVLNGAQIAATTADGDGAITVYESSAYTGIYISYFAEYSGGWNDTQLVYNAITYSGSTQCSSFTSCSSCANGNCVWCLDNQSCNSQAGSCKSFIKHSKYCPSADCSSFTDCNDCLSNGNNADCDWCLDSSQCIDIDNSSQCDDTINDPQYCSLKSKLF